MAIRTPPPFLFVGEAFGKYMPGRSRPLYPFPATSTGGRLHKFTGLSRFDYLEGTERVNVFLDTPKKWDKGVANATAKGIAWYAFERRQTLVLLGKKVSTAFGVTSVLFEKDAVLFPMDVEGRRGLGRVPVFTIPHTSGLCRQWNDPEVKDKAAVFFGAIRGIVGEYLDKEFVRYV